MVQKHDYKSKFVLCLEWWQRKWLLKRTQWTWLALYVKKTAWSMAKALVRYGSYSRVMTVRWWTTTANILASASEDSFDNRTHLIGSCQVQCCSKVLLLRASSYMALLFFVDASTILVSIIWWSCTIFWYWKSFWKGPLVKHQLGVILDSGILLQA